MALQFEGKVALITGAAYWDESTSSWPMLGSGRDSGDDRRLLRPTWITKSIRPASVHNRLNRRDRAQTTGPHPSVPIFGAHT
jgi:hypothetical protein